ncbi:zearalenone lactonase [Whalleya microplaca]|nr:zearalenone lactonase [Whalleya microplaca]
MPTTTLLKVPSSCVLSSRLTPGTNYDSSPVIVLSNPLCAPLASWDHVVPALVSLGFQVLCYDQPGHGSSTAPDDLSSTTFNSLAKDVKALLDNHRIRTVHAWVGVSMGAATGIVFAATYPGVIKRLIGCDTISCSPVNAGTEDLFASRVAEARRLGIMFNVTTTMERWFGRQWINDNDAEARRLQAMMLRTTNDGFETCCYALRSESFDLRPLVEDAGKGVERALLLVGEKDANLPESMKELRHGLEQGLKKNNPDASVELKVIQGAGHVCYIDGFEQFIEVITEFLT